MEKKRKLVFITLLSVICIAGTISFFYYSYQKNSINLLELKIETNIKEADIYVGKEKIGTTKDFKLTIRDRQVKKDGSLYAIKKVESGKIISSKVDISDIKNQTSIMLKFDFLSEVEQQSAITNYFKELSENMRVKGNSWSADSRVEGESQQKIIAILNRYAELVKTDELKDAQFSMKKLENQQLIARDTYQATINLDIKFSNESDLFLNYDIPNFVYKIVDGEVLVISFDSEKIKPSNHLSEQFLLQEELLATDNKKELAKLIGKEVYPELFGENDIHELSSIKEANNGELTLFFANKSEVSGKQLKVMFQGNNVILKLIETSSLDGDISSLYEYDLITKSVNQKENVYDIKYIFSSADLFQFVRNKNYKGETYRFKHFDNSLDNQGEYTLPKGQVDKDIKYRVSVSEVAEPTHLSQEVFWGFKNGKVYYIQNGYYDDWQELPNELIDSRKKSLKEDDAYGSWKSGDEVLELNADYMFHGVANSGVAIGGNVISTKFDDTSKILVAQTYAESTHMNPEERNDELKFKLDIDYDGMTILIVSGKIFYKK